LERREYDKLNAVEDEMWWFRGSHANLLTAFHGHAGRLPSGLLLDAGCGTGGLLAKLARELPEGRPIGLDADAMACAIARTKSGRPVCAGSANAMPFATGSLAAIFSADVLCHRNVDEVRALADFHRCLAGGGLLVMNLPSYQWLLSAHDHAVHNVRRYTQRRVRALLQGAGFARIRMTYWNTILFPLMVLRRLGAQREVSDVMPFPAPLELAFRGIMRIENRLLGHGIRLPFGGSLLATAIKS
jgi:SAM-dependent methyltransferase